MSNLVLAQSDVLPKHNEVHFLGLTFELGVILGTLVAGGTVVGLGLYMAAHASHGVPSKLQLTWEAVVNYIRGQVEANIGKTAPYVVPLAVTLFFFILLANWLEVVPTTEYVHSPSSNVALPYAMALFVIIWAYADGIRKRGPRNYARSFLQPFWWLAPFNLIDEIVKPVTLSLRLWGNIFGGTLMLGILALLPAYIFWLPHAGWRLFELFIGLIQAGIFALLTILYFGFAQSAEH